MNIVIKKEIEKNVFNVKDVHYANFLMIKSYLNRKIPLIYSNRKIPLEQYLKTL